MSENSGPGEGTKPRGTRQALQACTYMMWVSGSNDPPGQLDPPLAVPRVRVASGPSSLLTTGGVKTGPILNFETVSRASARSAGVKSIKSLVETPLRA